MHAYIHIIHTYVRAYEDTYSTMYMHAYVHTRALPYRFAAINCTVHYTIHDRIFTGFKWDPHGLDAGSIWGSTRTTLH